MSFRQAAGFILAGEIGNSPDAWVADAPADHGKRTVAGVTAATYDTHLLRWGTPTRPVDEIRMLEWLRITREYWDAVQGDYLPSRLGVAVCDTAFNTGPAQAIKLLQRVLAPITDQPLAVDGLLGPQTRQALDAALARHGEWQIFTAFLDARDIFYDRLAALNPSQRVFLTGWHRRVAELRKAVACL